MVNNLRGGISDRVQQQSGYFRERGWPAEIATKHDIFFKMCKIAIQSIKIYAKTYKKNLTTIIKKS